MAIRLIQNLMLYSLNNNSNQMIYRFQFLKVNLFYKHVPSFQFDVIVSMSRIHVYVMLCFDTLVEANYQAVELLSLVLDWYLKQ